MVRSKLEILISQTGGNMLRLALLLASLWAMQANAIANTQATWVSPVSGTWGDATKWSTNPTIPNGTSFDAAISAAGASYTVTLNNSTLSINNISVSSANATLNESAGTVTVNGLIDVSAGIYQLRGGTLVGGTLQSSGG